MHFYIFLTGIDRYYSENGKMRDVPALRGRSLRVYYGISAVLKVEMFFKHPTALRSTNRNYVESSFVSRFTLVLLKGFAVENFVFFFDLLLFPVYQTSGVYIASLPALKELQWRNM